MPAPGPMSTMWSAASIVSSSCSTTMTVLPRSRRRIKVDNSLWLSRWCRPMLGSSRIYKTPMRDEPMFVAKRIRWLSPPESVAAARESVRYSRPTLRKKPRRERISFKIAAAIISSRGVSVNVSRNASASTTERSQKSLIFLPPTVTARLSLERRLPPHASHGTALMYDSISSLIHEEDVSRKRRSRLLMMPSNSVSYVPRPYSLLRCTLIFSPFVP